MNRERLNNQEIPQTREATQRQLGELTVVAARYNPAEIAPYRQNTVFTQEDVELANGVGVTYVDLESFTRKAYPDKSQDVTLLRTSKVWRGLDRMRAHQQYPGTFDIFTVVENTSITYMRTPDESSKNSGTFALANIIAFTIEFDERRQRFRKQCYDLLGKNTGQVTETLLRHFMQNKLAELCQESTH